MSYHGDNDPRSYANLGPIGYQEPFPGGKPLNPYRDMPNQPYDRPQAQVNIRINFQSWKLGYCITTFIKGCSDAIFRPFYLNP